MFTDSGGSPSRRTWLPPHFRVSDRRRGTVAAASAQAQWKSRWGPAVWVSLLCAAAFHAALLLSTRESPASAVPMVRRGPVVSELIIPKLIDIALPRVDDLPRISPPPPAAGEARLFRDPLGEPAADRRETVITLDIPIELPPPFEIRENPVPEPPPVPAIPSVADEWASYTRFAPSMVRPEIVNQDEMRRFLNVRYARLVRTTGMEGTVVLRFWIDEKGIANRVELNDSSGFKQLDDLALQLAEILRFSPALQMGEAVRVFVELPIRFQAI